MASFTHPTVGSSDYTVSGPTEVGVITAAGFLVNGSIVLEGGALFNFGGVTDTGPAVEVWAANSYIENRGTLSSRGSYVGVIDGFLAPSGRLTLNNFGNISVIPGEYTYGIVMASGGNRITNSGMITAHEAVAIYIDDTIFGQTGRANVIRNTGIIQSQDNAAIYLANNSSDKVQNSGEILGGITFVGGEDRLVNHGTIDGNVEFSSTGNDTILNYGTITGMVSLALGDAILVNRGHIGSLSLGVGNDTVDLRGGTTFGIVDQGGDDLYLVDSADTGILDTSGLDTVRSTVDFSLADGGISTIERLILEGTAVTGTGNQQANTLTGNNVANRLDGGLGNDTVFSANGADTIWGEAGDDILYGELGDDVVYGGEGRDTISGGSGDELILGGDGNDRIVGVAGNDTIIGGAGSDVLFGGTGVDLFVYNDIPDANSSPTERIEDFVSGIDRIDLSAIDANRNLAGDNSFVLVNAFTNVAGQLVRVAVGPATQLVGDVNGDSVIDFSILLSTTASVSAGDLIL